MDGQRHSGKRNSLDLSEDLLTINPIYSAPAILRDNDTLKSLLLTVKDRHNLRYNHPMSTSIVPPPNYIPVPSRVDGITVYAPAPAPPPQQQEVIDFLCPKCGGTTAFSAASGGVTCAHCGYVQIPSQKVVGVRADELEFTTETMEHANHGWGVTRKDLECQQCGARTSVPAESLTHTCPFCGSNKVLQRQDTRDALRPRYLIPFQFDLEKCRAIIREWSGNSWMTPGSLKNLNDRSALVGIYLPYWTFDAVTKADWRAEVGHSETEQYFDNGEWKTRTVTVWRWEQGQVQLVHDDLLVEGTSRLSKLLLGKLNTYDMAQLTLYEPGFLAGLQALAFDVPLEPAWEEGRQLMREITRRACEEKASTNQIRNFKMDLDFSDESWRYILMPVYLAAYSYNQNKYQVMVNGQNGTITGQRPVDWARIWLVVASLCLPGVILCLLGLVTLPLGGIGSLIGVAGFVLFIIGVVIALFILRQAAAMDDI